MKALKRLVSLAFTFIVILSITSVTYAENLKLTADANTKYVDQEEADEYFTMVLGYAPVAIETDSYFVYLMANGGILCSPLTRTSEGQVLTADPRVIHCEFLESWSLIGGICEASFVEDGTRWIAISWVVGSLGEQYWDLEITTENGLMTMIGSFNNLEVRYEHVPFKEGEIVPYIEEELAARFIYDCLVRSIFID